MKVLSIGSFVYCFSECIVLVNLCMASETSSCVGIRRPMTGGAVVTNVICLSVFSVGSVLCFSV